MKIVNMYGQELDFEAIVQYMDDEIRERLHGELSPCEPQYFYEAYCVEHFRKFGEIFFTEESENIVW